MHSSDARIHLHVLLPMSRQGKPLFHFIYFFFIISFASGLNRYVKNFQYENYDERINEYEKYENYFVKFRGLEILSMQIHLTIDLQIV